MRELCGRGARALRVDSDLGTSGSRTRPGSAARNTAALHASRRCLARDAVASANRIAAGANRSSALRRADSTRRLAPALAGRTRSESLPEEASSMTRPVLALSRFVGPGNDLGRGRSARSLGASTRRSQGVVLRLERRLPAPANDAGRAGRHQARDAVFGRRRAKLGITIMAASSPQAEGRVVRHRGTHQDRLLKTMRLRGIVEYEAAEPLSRRGVPVRARRALRL